MGITFHSVASVNSCSNSGFTAFPWCLGAFVVLLSSLSLQECRTDYAKRHVNVRSAPLSKPQPWRDNSLPQNVFQNLMRCRESPERETPYEITPHEITPYEKTPCRASRSLIIRFGPH